MLSLSHRRNKKPRERWNNQFVLMECPAMAALLPSLLTRLLLLFLFFTNIVTPSPTAPISYDSCKEAASRSCSPFPSFTFPFAPSSPAGCGHPDFQVECSQGSAGVLSIGDHSFKVLALVGPQSPTALRLGFLDPIKELCFLKENTSLFDMFARPFFLACNKRTASSGPPAINMTQCKTTLGWLPCNPCDLIAQFVSGNFVYDLSNAEDLIRNGFKVGWKETDDRFHRCKECMRDKGLCGFNASDPSKPFLCYHAVNALLGQSGKKVDGQAPHSDGFQKTSWRIVIICASVVFGVTSMLAISVILHCCRNRPPAITPDELRDAEAVPKDEDELDDDHQKMKKPQKEGDDQFPTFSYQELEIATNCFDKAAILGDGGYGCVYRGHLNNGCIVAVKRMMHQINTLNQFHNEIRIMSKLKHPYLVCLLGSCKADRDLLLVYEYVSNGTLADHLHGARRGNHMSLEARLKIALQTAQALEYMHFYVTPTVVHRDVKSSNILLRSDLSVKLADFGLCRDMVCMEGASHVSTAPQGTLGYVDPEYYRLYRLSETSDVYSFGVVLMELITGMKALDYNAADRGEINLANLAVSMIQAGRLLEIIDPMLAVTYEDGKSRKTIEEMAELGFMCLAPCKDDRPNMKYVSLKLQQIESCLSSASTNAT